MIGASARPQSSIENAGGCNNYNMYVEAQDGIEEDQKGVERSLSADLEDAERADGRDVLEKRNNLR